jgi:translation elongation factor P/translation initiation factor 5A
MSKIKSPFRIVAYGSNFKAGLKVYINGTLWPDVSVNSSSAVVIGKGKALKKMVPKGVTTTFRFVNTDGGECSCTWVRG